MAMSGVLLKRKGFGLVEALVTLTASGSYATGGDTLDFQPLVGYTTKQPDFVTINGIAGYVYKYDKANKKVLVYQAPAVTGTVAATFAGTAVKPSFTVATGTAIAGGALGVDAATVAAKVVGGTAITTDIALTTTSPVGTITPAGLITGTVTGGAAGPLTEIPASSYPSGVTGDTIVARVSWFQ